MRRGGVLPQHALHCCWGAAEQGIRQGTNDVRQRWQRDSVGVRVAGKPSRETAFMLECDGKGLAVLG